MKMKLKMKKLFNVFLIGTFVFAALLVLPKITNASTVALEMSDDDYYDGGSGSTITSTPTPPPAPASTINLTYNINKTTYSPGEQHIILDVAVSRSVCSNVLSNIKVDGRVVGPGEYGDYVQILNQTVGGGTTISNSKYYTAPSTPGNYVMRTRVQIYSPGYYYAELYQDGSGIVGYVSGVTFDEVFQLAQSEVIGMPAGTRFRISYQPAGTTVLESAIVDIPFTVAPVVSPTANIHVITADGVVHESDTTIPAGQNVKVYWESDNATKGCLAKGINTQGTDILAGKPGITEIRKVSQDAINVYLNYKTTFSLICEN